MIDSLEFKLESAARFDRAWHKPEEYTLSDKTDKRILDRKFDNNEIISVSDNLDLIANELFSIDNPELSSDKLSKDEYVSNILGQGSSYGSWFLFPWSQTLVHFPPQEDHRRLRTARNRNLITEEEQRVLYAATLAIFGMSVGSNVVDKLVLSGIGGKLVLADPDSIQPTNLNRINGGFFDVGSKKIEYVARKISETDPYIEQVHIKERVDAESLNQITNEHQPDILIDEVDDLSAKVAIRLEGSASSKPIIMATDLGDKSIIDIERHDREKQTKPFNGQLKTDDIKALLGNSDSQVAKKALTKIIGIKNITPRLLDSFMEQGKSLAGIPQLGMTASMGGSLVALAAREILLDRKIDSGRYIFSPKNMFNLHSPTPFSVGVRTLINFAKSSKS